MWPSRYVYPFRDFEDHLELVEALNWRFLMEELSSNGHVGFLAGPHDHENLPDLLCWALDGKFESPGYKYDNVAPGDW